MNRMQLLGAAGLAASLMAAPAFAQNSGANNTLNNPSSYGNGGSYGQPSAADTASNGGNATSAQPGSRFYPTTGMGSYTAERRFIIEGNNNNNNANVNNGNNIRPSQRNNVLADNGDARASKVIGTAVYNSRDQKLGNVNDILIGTNGVFAVISTNNKQVAVPFGDLKFGYANGMNNDRVVLPDETQAKLNTEPVLHYNVSNYQGWNANNNGNGGGNSTFANGNGNGNGGGWNGGGGGNATSASNNGNGGGWNGNGGGPFAANGNNVGGGNNNGYQGTGVGPFGNNNGGGNNGGGNNGGGNNNGNHG